MFILPDYLYLSIIRHWGWQQIFCLTLSAKSPLNSFKRTSALKIQCQVRLDLLLAALMTFCQYFYCKKKLIFQLSLVRGQETRREKALSSSNLTEEQDCLILSMVSLITIEALYTSFSTGGRRPGISSTFVDILNLFVLVTVASL